VNIPGILWTLCVLFTPWTFAQTVEVTAKPLSDAHIQLLRSDVQADKNQIITHTMQFTDSESAAFWPVYRDYARDQQAIGDERVELIKDYAQHYDTIDDATAKNMTRRLLNIEAKSVNLRQEYWPRFEKALGAKRAAKFFQVDNRLTLLVDRNWSRKFLSCSTGIEACKLLRDDGHAPRTVLEEQQPRN
jgi:hypothetical protein